MGVDRRAFAGGAIVAALLGASRAGAQVAAPAAAPYGMIGRMKAKPGRRAELAAILRATTGAMPGCVAYLVNDDPADRDSLWITEVWSDKAHHDASLSLPAVRAAIAKGRPLIAGFDLSLETTPPR